MYSSQVTFAWYCSSFFLLLLDLSLSILKHRIYSYSFAIYLFLSSASDSALLLLSQLFIVVIAFILHCLYLPLVFCTFPFFGGAWSLAYLFISLLTTASRFALIIALSCFSLALAVYSVFYFVSSFIFLRILKWSFLQTYY